MTPCGAVIDEYFAEVEGAEKRFHVPETSSEVLSAIRLCCQDMEAFFSGLHVSKVGMRVMCGWHGGWIGRLVVSRMHGASVVGVALPEYTRIVKVDLHGAVLFLGVLCVA